MFEFKKKRFNLNCWAAREILTGRPAKHRAPAGCLSGCPHSSVTRGWAKRYGATWIVRSSSNPTAEGHRRRVTAPARTKPSTASGGAGGSSGYGRGSARRANNKVDDGDPPGTGGFSWGGSNRWLPSSPAAVGSSEILARWCSPSSENGVVRSVRRGE